ncbi:PREDICTED: solute carrier family 46 member 3 [Elephantulus edwardii]|uniref:solute carrier family 46 member 3 n=1 Tax=Elephantulus edwardii TaxID=28737 RepID=UPI0003F09035|nr:PREDICTED: solute carrier family 46 member 3 [Elephantulus edwardii]
MKIFFVEPAIFLSAFAMSLTMPLTTQYIYRRIWEETSNYSIAFDSNISECEKNKSSPIFILQKEVQKKASLFGLQVDLCGLIPGIVSTFILLSHSDHYGRKLPMVLSCVGSLATSVWLCLVVYLALPFQLLLASSFLGALCGNYTTFWGASFAYIVDQCKEDKEKTVRIAVVDLLLGLITGLTGLSSGYFIRELGFLWSFLIITLVIAVNLIYILFFLGTPTTEMQSREVLESCAEAFKSLLLRTYLLFKNAAGRRGALLCLLLFSMIAYYVVLIGISPIFILYELDAPLCWDEVFIGYGSALGSVSFVTSFLGIWIFSYCMEDIHMAFIGLFTTLSGMALVAFSRTTVMMLSVRLLFIFSIMPLSVLRSMLSKVVSSAELGTLFACISVLETLGGVIAVSSFNGIYSATVAWYPGFTFLLSAVLMLIPAISLCSAMCISRNSESYTLLIQEESGRETSDT